MTKQLKILNYSICYILLFATMNTTMMNVALPNLAEEFTLTPTEVSWVTAIFSLTFGIGSVIFGKLGDIFSIRRLIVIGVIVFMVGSLIGVISTSYGWIVIARIIQGFGAGALPSLSLVAAARFYPEKHRGAALAMVFSIVALGAALGPIFGGFLTEWLGWEALFAMTFLSLLGFPLFLKYAPKEETRKGRLDIVSAVLFMLAITAILMGINISVWFLLASAVLFLLFYWKNKQSADPFIEVSILKNSSYRSILLLSFLNTIAYMGILFITPLMLTDANDLSANWIGLILFPGAVFTTILGSQIGKLIGKKGSLYVSQWCFVVMAIACLGLSTIVGFSPVWICILLIPVFLGFTANQTSFSNYISEIVPMKQNGIAMGLFTLMTFLASAIGIALFSRFLEFDTGHWNVLNNSEFSSYSNVLLLTTVVGLVAITVLFKEKRKAQEAKNIVTLAYEKNEAEV